MSKEKKKKTNTAKMLRQEDEWLRKRKMKNFTRVFTIIKDVKKTQKRTKYVSVYFFKI